MTSEEWSLKGKDVDMVRVTDDKEDTFGYPAYPLDMLYSAKDIETLRQKLIEDFVGAIIWLNENYSAGWEESHLQDIKTKFEGIINRRFGVNK